MRVLVSFEREYRVYMESIAAAIRELRPEVEVAIADARELQAEAQRFDPQLVITSLHIAENLLDEQLARIGLSPESAQPSRFWVGQRRWESTNPTLSEILSVLEEAESLGRQTRE